MTEAPLAHSDDPESSHEAIDRHTASGRRETHCECAYQLVKRFPGCTARELSMDCHEFDLTELRRRLTDLKNQSRIEQGEQRQCCEVETLAVTWYPASLF